MNAAERFLAAPRAHHVEAAAAELAPGVVMLNPASDEPVNGRDAVAAALRGLDAACEELCHTHLLVGTAGNERPLYGLVFEARVGPMPCAVSTSSKSTNAYVNVIVPVPTTAAHAPTG